MSVRFETKYSDNWQRRSGYQRTMKVPGPILPMENNHSLLRRITSLIGGKP